MSSLLVSAFGSFLLVNFPSPISNQQQRLQTWPSGGIIDNQCQFNALPKKNQPNLATQAGQTTAPPSWIARRGFHFRQLVSF